MDHGSLSDRPARSTRIALVVIVAVCAFAMGLKPVRSPDVWHHVKSGWFVVQNHGPATVDVFSCTAQGKPWIQYEWLAQLAIYGIYEAGNKAGDVLSLAAIAALLTLLGIALIWGRPRSAWPAILLTALAVYGMFQSSGAEGLVLFQAAMAALLALLLMAAIRIQPRSGWPAAALATGLALCAVSPRFFERPEMFTWICFAGWLIAVEKVRAGKTAYFALPAILMVPWVNMHGAWPAGLAWLGLICAGETALMLFGAAGRMPKAAVLKLCAALGLAAAATLINPYGFHIWQVPLKLTSSPEMSAVIAEWQRPNWAHWLDVRHIGAWVFLLAMLAAPRRIRLSDALVVLAFGALALSARRHMALAMIAVAPVAAGQFSAVWGKWEAWEVWEKWELWGRLKKKRGLSPFLPFLTPFLAALISIALAIAALGGAGLPRAGIGVDHRMFPEGAARFLAEHKLDGNLFNTYDYGNYLLFARYPQNHVFIDGRVDVYGAEGLRLYNTVRNADPGWQKILEEHSIEICVLATEKKSTELRLLNALQRSRDWALVYWDDLSAVYVERQPDRLAFLNRTHIYTVRSDDFDPAVLELPERLARAEQDYRLRLREDPDFAFAAYCLARCLIQRDQFDEAVDLLERAVALDPENATFSATLGATLLQTGKLDEAERRLRAALKGYRSIPDATPALGVVYWNLSLLCEKKGDLAGALSAAEETARLRPEMTAAADRVRALKQKIAEGRKQP